MPLTRMFYAFGASPPRPPAAAVTSAVHRLDLLEACLPWMVGTHVMGRMIAQLVCYSVLPESVKDGDGAQLEGLFFFLRDNPDMVRCRTHNTQSTRHLPLPCTLWTGSLLFIFSALGLPATALCGLACSCFRFLRWACLPLHFVDWQALVSYFCVGLAIHCTMWTGMLLFLVSSLGLPSTALVDSSTALVNWHAIVSCFCVVPTYVPLHFVC